MELIITKSGTVRGLYSEEIELKSLGSASIRRASHVEPTPEGEWTADLSPVGGPLLGPFTQRSSALAAEVAWLEQHWLPQAR